MTLILIDAIELKHDGSRVDIRLKVGDNIYEIYFKTLDRRLSTSPESIIAAVLFPAMKKGAMIKVDESVSPRFLAGIDNIQELIRDWKPNYRHVDIHGVPEGKYHIRAGDGVGLFFSGGVDSYYSLLRNKTEITDIIYIHGFDIPLKYKTLRTKVSAMVREVGDHYGKGVIELETNIRELLDDFVYWGFTHGAAMASAAHLLADHFKKIYFAASYAPDRLSPWGTDPRIDPNWSTEGLEFIHDGMDSKVEKTGLVGQDPMAQKSIMVCLLHPGEKYNCGSCEKCRRTMLYLRVFGLLDQCTTFDTPFDLRDVYKLDTSSKQLSYSIEHCLSIVEERQDDRELEEALRSTLETPSWQKRIKHSIRPIRKKIKKRFK